MDYQHGDVISKAAEEAELVRSPRGTPRRSAKKIRISGLEVLLILYIFCNRKFISERFLIF